MNEQHKKIIEVEYKGLIITKKTITNIQKHPNLYTNSPIRTQMGKIYTNEDFRKKSDKVLTLEMPSGKKNVLQRILKRK